MKKDFENIESLFKESFNGFSVEPSAKSWENLNNKLDKKRFLSPGFKHFNVYYLSAFIVLVAVISLALIGNKDDINSLVNNDIIKNSEILSEKLTPNLIIKETETENKESRIKNKHFAAKKKDVKEESSRISEIIPFSRKQEIESIKIKEISPDLNKIKVELPNPVFELIDNKGCAPFNVKLINKSTLADSYEWDFGDGAKSTEKSPTYTYRYAGVYTIKLKAYGSGGVAVSVMDSIIVHEPVDNVVSASFNEKLTEGEPFGMTIETNQEAVYEWSFGDGTYSYLKNPIHKYDKEGEYAICLKTINSNNCYDSLLIMEANVISSNNKIIFPNAFTPNTTGSSGGKYGDYTEHNEVFHPKKTGARILNYSFKVFSRSGLLLFETDDINFGWDGYYQNKLMPEGVYVFVASGQFEGEPRPFQKRGDITLLYRRKF